MPYDTWNFLKKASIDQDMSMTEIIINCVEKLQEKNQKKIDEK